MFEVFGQPHRWKVSPTQFLYQNISIGQHFPNVAWMVSSNFVVFYPLIFAMIFIIQLTNPFLQVFGLIGSILRFFLWHFVTKVRGKKVGPMVRFLLWFLIGDVIKGVCSDGTGTEKEFVCFHGQNNSRNKIKWL